MSAFGGAGMLGLLGEDAVPRGTIEELRAVGLDPSKIGSCAPRSSGVRGCNQESACIFAQARYGGFKGRGPRNVGYYLRTHEGSQKQDFCTCHAFIHALGPRMQAGEIARQQGQPHEQVRIIAQEGEWITINPIVQVDPNDTKPTAAFKRDPHRVMVPRHPRPGDNPQITYEQQMWAEEEVRRKYDAEFSPAEWKAPPELAAPDSDTLDMGTTTLPAEPAEGIVAEPVAKGAKK